MVMLVSLQQASDHLRRDTTDDDADLTLKIHAASAAIQNYLKDPMLAYDLAKDQYGELLLDSFGEPYLATDSAGDYIPRQEVQIAVLIMIGVFYNDRDGKEYVDPSSGGGLERLGNMSLPKAVHWLLDPIRKPTMQ